MVISIAFSSVQNFAGSERRGRGAAPGPVSLARKCESTRTARGHLGAGNNIMSRQEMTFFASAGGVRRFGNQAFFDKYLPIDLRHRNRIAASSNMPPAEHKNGGFECSKPRIGKIFEHGERPLPSSGFFFSAAGQIRNFYATIPLSPTTHYLINREYRLDFQLHQQP